MYQPYFEATPGMIVSEDDVRRLILGNQKMPVPAKIMAQKSLRAILTIGLMTVVAYTALNAPSLWIKSSFVFKNDVFPIASTSTTIGGKLPDPTPANQSTVYVAPTTQPENTLSISRLDISAPVIWDIPNTNSDVLSNLQNGVVALKGNAKPGQTGNIFIVGHSSNYLWAKGDYNHIFTLLTEAKIGDVVTITYQNRDYHYRINGSRVVLPSDLSVLDNSGPSRLTLMTCVPIGTNAKRLIVTATPIDSDYGLSTNSTPIQSQSGQLPAAL